VQEITAAAGVPKGSFYNYFDSKEAFAVEVLSEYWDDVVELYGPILTDQRSRPLSRITRYFEGLADFHARHGYAVGCLIGNMALDHGLEQRRPRQVGRDLSGMVDVPCRLSARGAGAQGTCAGQRRQPACRRTDRYV